MSAFAVLWTVVSGGSSRGPAEGLFSVEEGILALRSGTASCDVKGKTCLGEAYALVGGVPDTIDGLHLVVADGVVTWSDASGHFDVVGNHVGGADVHCFAVDEALAGAFSPSRTWEFQLGRGDGTAIGTRVEELGRAEGWAGADTNVTCVAFGADNRAEWQVILAGRGLDDPGPGTAGQLGFTDDEDLIDF